MTQLGYSAGATLSSTVFRVAESKGRYLVYDVAQQAVDGDEGDSLLVISRVFADGSLDKTFGTKGQLVLNEEVTSIRITEDRILGAGGSSTGLVLSSLTANGKADDSFGGGDGVSNITESKPADGSFFDPQIEQVLDDGSVLTMNEIDFRSGSIKKRLEVVKTNPDGSIDTSFGTNGVVDVDVTKDTASAQALLTTSGLYVQVDYGLGTTPASGDLYRFTPDGKALDNTFGTNGKLSIPGFATAFAEQSDGKLLFVTSDGTAPVLHRLKNDGTTDTSFGTNGTITLSNSAPIGLGAKSPQIILDAQNRITVAANGTLFRFSSSGTLDAYPFNGTAPFDGGPISYDDQGRVVVGGPFGITFGQPYGLEPIAQLDQNGIAHVYGTNGDDTVAVSTVTGGKLRFTMNGETVDLVATDVKGIRMDMYAGATNINAPVDFGETIMAGLGDDSIITGDGDDSIVTAEGSDTLQLGGGNDTVSAGNSDSKTDDTHTITATGGNKTIGVVFGSSNINLPAGNHDITTAANSKTNDITIAGGNNNVTLSGIDATLNIAAGDNTISTSASGNVSITTGGGKDSFTIRSLGAVVHAGGGDDNIEVDTTSSTTGPTLFGDAGNDTIKTGQAQGGVAEMHGGDGNDSLVGGAFSQTMYGEGGKDTLEGGDGNDYLSGGGANDKLHGDAGNDTIFAGDGDDAIDGGSGNDFLNGQDGHDTIFGGSGDDKIYGGASSDWIYAQAGNNRVYGEGGDDHIYADSANSRDTLYGGAGNDTFYTSDGTRDLISGDGGTDRAFADKKDLLTSIER